MRLQHAEGWGVLFPEETAGLKITELIEAEGRLDKSVRKLAFPFPLIQISRNLF